MPHLLVVLPSQGGSGDFHGPIDGHFSHPVPGSAQYFIQNTLTTEWQDMHNPIHTRKIIDYPKNRQWQLQQDQTQSSPPIPDQYYRFRTRMI
jgi:hypothetical protein